mmetsp:Transcript_15701/g.49135  ORF Transcript_15701/g.49135 Transcript_15701/m.49135 type:complete len:118 (-) Transcript_15701:301-654(-)
MKSHERTAAPSTQRRPHQSVEQIEHAAERVAAGKPAGAQPKIDDAMRQEARILTVNETLHIDVALTPNKTAAASFNLLPLIILLRLVPCACSRPGSSMELGARKDATTHEREMMPAL